MRLRKQLLGVKGKVFVTAVYAHESSKKKITLTTNSKSMMMDSEINLKRAIINAILKGIGIAVVKYGFPSGTELVEIIKYGISYDNNFISTKTFNIKGRRYTAVYMKGKRGMISKTAIKGNTINKNFAKDAAIDDGLLIE